MGTWAIEGHFGIRQKIKYNHFDTLASGTRKHFGSWVLEEYLGTWAIKVLGHFGEQALGHLGTWRVFEPSGNETLEALYLAHSWNMVIGGLWAELASTSSVLNISKITEFFDHDKWSSM